MIPKPVITVGIIGSGNLAWSLAANLKEYHFSIEQVISRNLESAKAFAKHFEIPVASESISEIFPDLDLVFLLTQDTFLKTVSEELAHSGGKNTLFVHCSGSAALEEISAGGRKLAVMWPLQTFSKNKILSLKNIPLFIEAEDSLLPEIREIAQTLSEKVFFLNSGERQKMHLAAVISGNFSTVLFSIAEKISKETTGKGLELFIPYLEECLTKANEQGPMIALTGPAKRGDQNTMNKHIQFLKKEGKTDEAELYSLMSKIIQKK